jgi:hypothetical protein
MGKTDHVRGRDDMKDMGIREELWLRPYPNILGQFSKPHAMYVLSPAEREKVLDVIGKLRTPTDYAASIHSQLRMVASDL